MAIWKDIIEPPSSNYTWYRLNEDGGFVGIFKYDGSKWILQKNKKSGEADLSSIIGDAPEEYDTLGEIANALGNLSNVAYSGDYADLTNAPNQRTFKEFKSNWPTGTTLEAFCSAIINDSDANVGNAYLGGLSCSGLPAGMRQGDVVVEVIGTNNNKVVKLTLTSTDVSPYHWEGCYWQGSFRGWKSFELQSNKVTSFGANPSDANYPSEKLVKDSLDNKQGYYTVPTSQISNPKEGDISAVPDSIVMENMQTGSGGSLNNGTYLRISDLSGLGTEVLRNGGKIEITGSFLGFISGTVCSIEVRLINHTPTLIVTDFKGEEYQINWQQGFDAPAQILSYNTPYTVGYITITETVESGQHSILQYVKIDSLRPGSVQEYKNGAWIDRKNFPTTFDSLPTDGSENLIKSGGVAAGIKSMAQSYCGVSTEPSSQKEGDVWDSPEVESIAHSQLSGGTGYYMPDSNYQTKITLMDGATTVSISVRMSDNTTVTLTDPSEFPKIYPAGEVDFVDMAGTGLGVVYNYQPAFKKVYHDGSWIDLDTMFPTVDNTPTANSNNLVKSGGVYSEIHPAVQSSQPVGGFAPNVVYDLGTLTGTVTFALAAGASGVPNPYHWTFDTGSTPPTVSWPSNIIWTDDIAPAPTLAADKHYEITVRNGYATLLVFSLPTA